MLRPATSDANGTLHQVGLSDLIQIKDTPGRGSYNSGWCLVHSLQGIRMSSFSCPHFEMEREYCMRLRTDCVPGRPGCVLAKNSVFAVPVEDRIRAKEEAKRRVQDNG